MNDTFWMFAIMLMLITLISSIGGGIRYRENFLDEVLDLNDSTLDPPTGYDYYPVHHPAKLESAVKKVSFEDDKKIEEEDKEEEVLMESTVQEEEPVPIEPVVQSEPVPIELKQPSAVPSKPESTPEFVVPYGGVYYAPF